MKAPNINKVIIAGNVTREIKEITTKNGKSISLFTVAINKSYKDQNNEWQSVVSYIDVKYYNKIDLKQGEACVIDGEIKQERWEKDGEKISRVLIVAKKIHKLTENKESKESQKWDVPF